MNISDLANHVKAYPDFPKPGILFRDISGVLENPEAMNCLIEFFVENIKPLKPGLIAGVDSRGFLFSTLVADRLGIGSLMIRKDGKLPGETYTCTYDLEYGTATLAIQKDRNINGQSVVIMDDLLATGGTLVAAINLVEQAGGHAAACAVAIELPALQGRQNITCDLITALEF